MIRWPSGLEQALTDLAVDRHVNRLAGLPKGVRAGLVEALVPGSNGFLGDEKDVRSLGQRPVPHGTEFEDGQAFGRLITRSFRQDECVPCGHP
jgi:hypothetical protein